MCDNSFSHFQIILLNKKMWTKNTLKTQLKMGGHKLSSAAAIDGYKKVKPAFFIFSLDTVVLFKTSTLISPKSIFNINEGTCMATKNLPFLFFANAIVKD